MKIERFEAPGLAQYSYVVSDEGDAVVIDPARDVDRYLSYATEEGLHMTHVLETHIHADYASGAMALAKACGAELAVSACDKGERYHYAMPHRALADGDSLEIGSGRIRALHTPGHTPEHLSFLLYESTERGVDATAMFSGDFLFAGSLGRPDLLGEEAKVGLAHDLYRSVHERIAGLPDSLMIYPGHGAGSLCGAGMSDRATTTLGYERETNAYLGYSETEFVEKILGSVPPMPEYYLRMKALNSKGAPELNGLPGGIALSVEAVAALRKGGAFLLDLRKADAFWGEHVPGAVNIGGAGNLSLWAGWVIDAKKQIVLIGDEDGTEESRRGLIRVGLEHIAGYLDGGMAAWAAAGFEMSKTPQISVSDVSQLPEDVLVLDVRNGPERVKGYISGSEHVMLGSLANSLRRLPKTRQIVTVCGTGYRSSIAASLLEEAGFKGLRSMAGGMSEWKQRGLPIHR